MVCLGRATDNRSATCRTPATGPVCCAVIANPGLRAKRNAPTVPRVRYIPCEPRKSYAKRCATTVTEDTTHMDVNPYTHGGHARLSLRCVGQFSEASDHRLRCPLSETLWIERRSVGPRHRTRRTSCPSNAATGWRALCVAFSGGQHALHLC